MPHPSEPDPRRPRRGRARRWDGPIPGNWSSVGRVGLARRTRVCVALFVAAAACTASTPAPAPSTSSASASETVPPAPSSGSAEPDPDRADIRALATGSLLVHGTYPHTKSSCRHHEQPQLLARYPGTLEVRRADDGSLSLTVTLPFEQYLDGLAEVPPTWPVAALEAQAIAARSYALATTGWDGPQGATLKTPICASASCQVYGGIPAPPTPGIGRWYAAVHRTEGQTLIDAGRPIEAVYFSTSDGHTYGNDQVFGSEPLPYLRPVAEHDDAASPTSHWRVPLPFGDLATFLRAAGLWPSGAKISRAARRGSSMVVRGGGMSRRIDIGSFDAAVNQWGPCLMPDRYPPPSRYGSPLPSSVPSGWYTTARIAGGVVLNGRGWGHGVGLVQWGAHGKAEKGWSASRILSYYYGGLKPQTYPEPGLIHVQVADGLTSVTTLSSTRGTILDETNVSRTVVVKGGDALHVSARPTRGGAPAMTVPATGADPLFGGEVLPVGPALRARLIGRNWHEGCPVPIRNLRLVRVAYWDFNGQVRRGPLVVNEKVADDVLWVFRRLFDARFPIHRIALPPRYRPPEPSDRNNTRDLSSAFNCRPATGSTDTLSEHSYGWAIDINPLRNPYVGPDGRVLRRAVKPYLNRARQARGMIHNGDVVVRSFAAIGWEWGGNWDTLKDYMHFSATGK
jgi:SpoIID/LytB domain protein